MKKLYKSERLGTPRTILIIQNKLRLASLALMLCTTMIGRSQTVDDFRSAADGNWNLPATWQRYDGSNWVTATYYPGNGTTNNVSITNEGMSARVR